jgi:ubiquinone/menaquinone biosynthesis C-methylase UbiE
MRPDYNEIAQKYDLNRIADMDMVIRLVEGSCPSPASVVIDFGCGTGNYAYAFKKLTDSVVIGIEPSSGMRDIAISKGAGISFFKGDHTCIPLGDDHADFIYMTDVIHHIPDIGRMFAEFYRVLKHDGLICIVTESYGQIESRYWVKYFPELVIIEKRRYPDIPELISTAENSGFNFYKEVSTDKQRKHQISDDFVSLVENKGFSMFGLLSDSEYRSGLEALKQDQKMGNVLEYMHGETLLWLKTRK